MSNVPGQQTQVEQVKFSSQFCKKANIMTDDQAKEVPNPQELSKVVQGTAENLLNRLEENLTGEQANGVEIPEEQLLTFSHPGPLDKDGKNVEDVLNIISQSILREGEGDRTILLEASCQFFPSE